MAVRWIEGYEGPQEPTPLEGLDAWEAWQKKSARARRRIYERQSAEMDRRDDPPEPGDEKQ